MADASAKRRPSILLLEDDIPLRDVVCANLSDTYEIETATNVEEALLLLGSRPYDILLCDQMLPGKKQGLDFLMEAQQRQPEAKRILVTGYMNPELLTRSVKLAGLTACLMKPVFIPDLRQTLSTALGRVS